MALCQDSSISFAGEEVLKDMSLLNLVTISLLSKLYVKIVRYFKLEILNA